MNIVGLTGGIACGKSAVAEILRQRGVPVLDADEVAREVVAPGTPGLAKIVEVFGAEALGPDGALDRAAMRRRIAHDPRAKRQLEQITHPAITASLGERLQRLAASGAAVAVVEAALMIETGSYRAYPVVIVVSCAPERQLARLMARDGATEADARALIASQLPLADKERVATHVIRNDGDRASLHAAVDAVWARIVPPASTG